MSAEIASFDRVRAAVAQLRVNGGVATADRVIAHLGGGSKATVLRHLKKLREADNVEEVAPFAIMELAKPALSEIYAAGLKSGEDRSAAGLVRLTAAISEMEAQVDELAAENQLLHQRLNTATDLQAQTELQLREVAAALEQAQRNLQTTRNELFLERGVSAEKLSDLMSRMEASVALFNRSKSKSHHHNGGNR